MKEIVDYGVLGILVFLSIVVLGVALERWWLYHKIDLREFKDKRVLELLLHKRLTLIATIGSNAPYVGLLGTVIGIMVTFVEIGSNSLVDTQSIMSGLALALKATAAGLVVAIPSIVFYNLLLRKAEVLLSLWDITHNPLQNTPKSITRYDV
ncbi:TonB-system energizer ExbB [Helicobacter cinaedi]|uniref:Biopolymer transport protein n=1 Tax=Helicobacter cinaedi TaxID=213 RepID=A0A377JNF6_9HELI|nr:TonB-system energizer ExbB [Helicobacter cinaedi]STP09286.1 biopolymer transport protein [Helicobacter cinaedi]STP11213.1 biopolymer transport protein [Helicobacter cinaedi]